MALSSAPLLVLTGHEPDGFVGAVAERLRGRTPTPAERRLVRRPLAIRADEDDGAGEVDRAVAPKGDDERAAVVTVGRRGRNGRVRRVVRVDTGRVERRVVAAVADGRLV